MSEAEKKRKQLLATFQAVGLEDAMKKEMRTKIIQKLQAIPLRNLEQTFQIRIIVSLISEYLTYNQLYCSNSIFLPDSGYQGKVLNRNELASLMNIDESKIEMSLLQLSINQSFPLGSVNTGHQDNSSQTFENDFPLTLQQKFNSLQQQYKQKLINSQSKQVLNISIIRRQIQVEFKDQYQRDLRRFKQFEIQTVRIQQRQKVKKKYDQYASKVEQTYKRKLDDLRKQSSRMYDIQQSTRRQKQHYSVIQKSSIQQQRQLLKMKQMQIEQKSKLLDMSKLIQSQNIRKLQTELSDKIKQHDTLNLRMVEKINYEVGLVKLSLQKQYQDSQMQFMERKKVVDQQFCKLEAVKQSVELIERQNKRLVDQNTQLRKQVKDFVEQINQLIVQNKQGVFKIQAIQTQRQSLKDQVKRLEQNKKQLSAKVSKLQIQLTQTRNDLDNARNNKSVSYQQQEQMPSPPIPISQGSAMDDLLKKMEEISRNRKKDIDQLKQSLDE